MLRRARGSVIIWVTLAMGMLLAFIGLVLNAGHFSTVHGELQNGVDAASLAGALQLDGTAAELTPSENASRNLASLHSTDRQSVAMAADQVLLGEWRDPARAGCDADEIDTGYHDSQNRHFCEVTTRDAAAALRINGVYTRAQRASGVAGGGAVSVYLNTVLGSGGTTGEAADALAVTGGPCNSANLCIPMVVGVGCLTAPSGSMACDPSAPADSAGPMYVLGLSSTQVRSAGWSGFTSSNPGAPEVCSVLQDRCTAQLGQTIEIGIRQGNIFTSNCTGSSYGNKICDWFKTYVGQSVTIPTVSLSGSLTEACPSNYNGTAYVVGFATFRVLAANCTASARHPDCVGDAAYCANANSPCSQYAAGQCVLTQLVCNHQTGNGGTGCAWTGTSTYQPVLVETRGAN